MSDDAKKSLRCSFCGKHEQQVHRMIQGPGVRICDECVQLCMRILGEEFEDEDTAIKVRLQAVETDSKSVKDRLPDLATKTELKALADHPLIAARRQEGIPKEFFEERTSKLKRELSRALGEPAAARYTPRRQGNQRLTGHALGLEPHQVRFAGLEKE